METDLEVIRDWEVDPAEPETFGRAYEHYFRSIYNYIRYRVSDAATADDLTSVTFHKALTRLASFDPSRAAFNTWLLTIARNSVNDHLRATRRRRILSLGWLLERKSDAPDPETALIDSENRDRLQAAIARLPERERDILGLKFAAGETNRAIARLTGQSEGNVGVIVHRAIGKLRGRLNAEEAGP